MDPSGGDKEDVLQTQADDLDFDIRRNLMFWIDKKEKKVTKQKHKDVKLEKKTIKSWQQHLDPIQNCSL